MPPSPVVNYTLQVGQKLRLPVFEHGESATFPLLAGMSIDRVTIEIRVDLRYVLDARRFHSWLNADRRHGRHYLISNDAQIVMPHTGYQDGWYPIITIIHAVPVEVVSYISSDGHLVTYGKVRYDRAEFVSPKLPVLTGGRIYVT